MAIAIQELLMPARKTSESSDIGKRLRVVRNGLGLKALAVAIGMGLTSAEGYRQYEKGNIVNWPAAIPKLARGLGIDPAALAASIGVPYDASLVALEGRIYTELGAEEAHLVNGVFDALVDLPPHVREKWFVMERVLRAGLIAEARENHPNGL